MRVNSVMFFSFNSEIVMFTYGDFAEGRVGGWAGSAPKARRAYAARRCASEAVSGSTITSCRLDLYEQILRWWCPECACWACGNLRVALEASWHSM